MYKEDIENFDLEEFGLQYQEETGKDGEKIDVFYLQKEDGSKGCGYENMNGYFSFNEGTLVVPGTFYNAGYYVDSAWEYVSYQGHKTNTLDITDVMDEPAVKKLERKCR